MESVTTALAQHQRETEWERRALFEKLQEWVHLFDQEFDLQVPDVALRVDRLSSSLLGHYRSGRNGFGLRGEVALNTTYISPGRFWRVLATLLHELVHAWQHVRGYPSRRGHNEQFIKKLESLGILYHPGRGSEFPSPSLFRALLARHGVVVPATTEVPDLPARSPIPTWSCTCTSVRVTVPRDAELTATCLRCGHRFSMDAAKLLPRPLREC